MDKPKMIKAVDTALRCLNNTTTTGVQNAANMVNAYNALIFIKKGLQEKEKADEIPTSERGQQE